MGVTFTVYGHEEGTEKIFPFDVVLRVVEAKDWDKVEIGLKQRIFALNLFLDDIYHDQKILKDKVILREIIETAEGNVRGRGRRGESGLLALVRGAARDPDHHHMFSRANPAHQPV